MSGLVERQFRQRRSDRAEPGNAGRQLLLPGLGHVQSKTQPVSLVGHGPNLGRLFAQYPGLPMQTQVLARQLLGGLPDALRPLLLLVQLLVEFADRPVPPRPTSLLSRVMSLRSVLIVTLRRASSGDARSGRASAECHPTMSSAPSGSARIARSWATSLTSASIVPISLNPMPASESRVSRRATAARNGAAAFAARRRSFASSTASLSRRRSGREARLPRSGIATGGHFGPARALHRALPPPPPATVAAHKGIRNRAPLPLPSAWEATKPRRRPRPASPLRRNHRPEPPCARQ